MVGGRTTATEIRAIFPTQEKIRMPTREIKTLNRGIILTNNPTTPMPIPTWSKIMVPTQMHND